MSAVVGGGYTDLSWALHLAQAATASGLGRNGGQLSALRPADIERCWPNCKAASYGTGCEAVQLVRTLIDVGQIDCGWRDGVIHTIPSGP